MIRRDPPLDDHPVAARDWPRPVARPRPLVSAAEGDEARRRGWCSPRRRPADRRGAPPRRGAGAVPRGRHRDRNQPTPGDGVLAIERLALEPSALPPRRAPCANGEGSTEPRPLVVRHRRRRCRSDSARSSTRRRGNGAVWVAHRARTSSVSRHRAGRGRAVELQSKGSTGRARRPGEPRRQLGRPGRDSLITGSGGWSADRRCPPPPLDTKLPHAVDHGKIET